MSKAIDHIFASQNLRNIGSGCANTGWNVRSLVRQATLAASSNNTQPWKFQIRPESIAILPDFTRRCPAGDPEDRNLFKSLGCAAENIVQAATREHRQAAVRFDGSDQSVVVDFQQDPALRPSDLADGIPARQCSRTVYSGGSVGANDLVALQQSAAGQGVRVEFLTTNRAKEAVMECVRQANAIQYKSQAFQEELISWMRLDEDEIQKARDGLAYRVIGQKSVPRPFAKYLLPLSLSPERQTAIDSRHIRSSAGVAVFVASEDDEEAWVEIGRSFERFALKAALLDVRVAFVNQPLDVSPVRKQFQSWLGLRDEGAHMLVRFGYGPTSPFSLRRPLEDVIL